MTRTGGTSDSTVHTCTLLSFGLLAGTNTNWDMSNTTYGCTSAQSLVNGAIYQFVLNGTDLAGNVGTTITHTGITFDTSAPTLSSTSPTNNATGVALAATLSMTFNETVTVNAGYVTIKRHADNSTYQTINISSATGSGTSTITITPSPSLESDTQYYINIDSGALLDAAGNSYAGISNTTSWTFTSLHAASLGYETTGHIVSQSIDLGNASLYPTIHEKNALRAVWTQNIPTGCSLTVKLRGTNTESVSEGQPDTSTYPAWASQTAYSDTTTYDATVTVSKDLTGDSSLQNKRFFQYRVDFNNCGSSHEKSPTLYDLSIDYD